jgi:hypothetical protein
MHAHLQLLGQVLSSPQVAQLRSAAQHGAAQRSAAVSNATVIVYVKWPAAAAAHKV